MARHATRRPLRINDEVDGTKYDERPVPTTVNMRSTVLSTVPGGSLSSASGLAAAATATAAAATAATVAAATGIHHVHAAVAAVHHVHAAAAGAH
eukprot:CAMPEP_0185464580 /NCGR_PEP_ID=MMETSP1365-20130426/95803_1 /TAXON_ID=38817 /ORGANISM="Gephyrocapsa oceanica, Strain RCC1303" /LENGTH=94 /DNA_ID=CAMNT_0028071319 /DNA_START=478 /DNA_END=761 /DNA_ORIENTATION=-